MEHEVEVEQYEPFFIPLTKLGAKTRDLQFLCSVGKVLMLSWLKNKTYEDVKAILALLLPSFACGCVENNDFVALQEILVRMDVNVGDYDGYTAMHRACEMGKGDIVKYLLYSGATCHLENRFGCTPLHLAMKNKHFDLIKILRLKGASVTLKPVRIGMDLIKAVRTTDYQLLHAWYLAGVNMNQGDYNRQTALHVAVKKRDKDMVAKLLEYGATPWTRDVWERTAADEASMNDLHDILVLFQPCCSS